MPKYMMLLLVVLAFGLVACEADEPEQAAIDPVPGVIPVALVGTEMHALGQQTYDQHCAACHGAAGEGQFPEAPMQPDATGRIGAPPHDGTGHTWHHPDGLLVRYVIEGGLGDPDRFYPMPALGGVLSDDQVIAVIAYIKTMWSVEQQIAQRDATLSTQQGG